MKAIIIVEEGKAGIRDIPVPSIPDGWLLVKVKALAVNPTDWKHIDWNIGGVGARCGCDYAGVVEALGAGAQGFEIGDRIAGFCHGGNRANHNDGAFAEHILVKPGPQIKIPDNLTDEEAATIGVSITTVAQGLYKFLGLPLPNEPASEPFPVLIYGGSTATGTYGIQFAKASGLTVITTASPRNFAYLRSLGADAVFDYNSPTCLDDIRAFSGGKLEYAWDCVGAGEDLCEKAMGGPGKGKIGTIVTDTELEWTLAYDVFGETYPFFGDTVRVGDPEEVAFCAKFWPMAGEMLSRGDVKPIRLTVNRGGSGLEGVLKGINDLRSNLVSAEKLVYTMDI